MNSVICPKCGTVNSANAMNCRQCKVNLSFALQNPDVVRGILHPSPEPQVVQEFSPSKLRYFMWWAGVFAIGTMIGITVSYITRGYVSSSWIGAVLGAATILAVKAFVAFRNYKVVITEDSISGPSASATNIVDFKFDQVDMNKTRRRSILEKIQGDRSIYSVDGKRIVLNRFAYNQNQIQSILKSIGYDESE